MEAINFISKWVEWLLAIIPIGAGVRISYQAMKKSMTDDQAIISDCNIKIKNTIKGAIVAITVSGTITFIKRYFT